MPSTKEMMKGKMVEGTKGAEFVDELKPQPGDCIIPKRRGSAFYNTIRDAVDRDFAVIILSDCCADMMKESHDHSMNTFRGMGRVRISDQIVAALRK